jgi:hypothetical protein
LGELAFLLLCVIDLVHFLFDQLFQNLLLFYQRLHLSLLFGIDHVALHYLWLRPGRHRLDSLPRVTGPFFLEHRRLILSRRNENLHRLLNRLLPGQLRLQLYHSFFLLDHALSHVLLVLAKLFDSFHLHRNHRLLQDLVDCYSFLGVHGQHSPNQAFEVP